METWALLLTGIFGIAGFFGWSHKSLKDKISTLENKMANYVNEREARLLIEDKLAPHRVEYYSLSRRIDELRESYKELNTKLDQVLELCTKFSR